MGPKFGPRRDLAQLHHCGSPAALVVRGGGEAIGALKTKEGAEKW